MWFPTFILCVVFCGDAVSAAPAADAAAQPFHMANAAPADVTLMLHLENAATIRVELADRPIAQWISALGESSKAVGIWQGLAAQTKIDSLELFDLAFGSRATLFARSRDEWTLITRLSPDRAGLLLASFKPLLHGPRFGMSIHELPEHDLLIARSSRISTAGEGILVIGPKARPQLFDHVLRLLDKPDGESLATSEALQRAMALGAGHIGLYIQHDPPMGGWSVLVANVVGEHISVRQQSKFESAPFSRGITRTRVDGSALASFEDHALLAIVEPTDVSGGQIETFIRASLGGREMVTGPMRRNLSDRRIIVVGEIEGRQEPRPVDIQATTMAVCMEVKDSAIGQGQFDRQMVSIAKRLSELGRGKFEIAVPCESTFKPGEPRAIDISSATQWLTGTLPLAQPITLNWTVINKPGEEEEGGWAVIATHPQQLHDSVRALRRQREADEHRSAHSCGFASGPRIGQHLRSWSDRADLFAGDDDAAMQDEFRASLLLMSKLASGVERVRWSLNRPSENEMCLHISLKLAAPESARE